MPGTDVKAKLPINPQARAKARGSGVAGLKRNAVPYVRVNKRSQTVGVNAGTMIAPNRRIVIGGYVRVESATKSTAIDKAISKQTTRALGTGTRRARVVGALGKRVQLSNPALRATVGGAQARLGTSRMAGPTVIVRRGSHKTAQAKSAKGVQKYDARMRTVAGKKAKKPRPQRRNKR